MIEFVLNEVGIVELLDAPEFAADIEKRAKAVAEKAQETAPYSDRDENEEHYRDAITSGTYIDDFVGKWGPDSRVTGYVQAGVPWACTVEVRNHTLRNALSAAEEPG